MSIIFIDPVADCLVPAIPYRLSIDLNREVTIGLVINKIVDCDLLMAEVGLAIKEIKPNIKIRSFATEKITFADSDLIQQIADECDGAICAIGHCGSCTAGTVKDGIALIENEIPTVSLITELFWEQAKALAQSLGWPESPRVKLPYPIWGTDKEYMQLVAKQVAGDIVLALEGRREKAA